MNNSHPRILWAYDHQIERYQQINLFIQAGFEVIVTLGNLQSNDPNYHNETHRLYPQWRDSCSLATNIIEKIRSIPIHETGTKPELQFIDLINDHIDAIVLKAPLPNIVSIMSWFKGSVIYRSNGDYNQNILPELEQFFISNPHLNKKFIYCPNLANDNSHKFLHNVYIINACVAAERLPMQWSIEKSLAEISTAISVINNKESCNQQYITSQISALPINVVRTQDEAIIDLPYEEFYYKIAQSRLFIESSPITSIFPILDAIYMGTPVLFLKDSAIAIQAMSKGYSQELLSEAGMCENFAQMNQIIESYYNDFNKLRKIVKLQKKIFVCDCFSYYSALKSISSLYFLILEKKKEKSASLIDNISQSKSPSNQPIRLLWTYDHPTARAQEVTLQVEVGFEVIVSLGNPGTLKYDSNYHNETSELYPKWRSSCTLESNITEKIRKICLIDWDKKVSSKDKELINKHIHAILLSTEDPTLMSDLVDWFNGIILYRINGYVSEEAQYKFWNPLLPNAKNSKKWLRNFYFCAGQRPLMPADVAVLYRNYLIVNIWIDKTRVTKEWLAHKSEPCITTAISYIDHHYYYIEQYHNIVATIDALPLKIIGKNDKKAPLCLDERITGPLSHERVYQQIAESRIFVDAGRFTTHFVLPPIESMFMGVPVLYHINSGFAATALMEGYSKEDLYQAGMFNSFEDINNFISNHYDDIETLKLISDKQRHIFIDDIFSRHRSYEELEKLLKQLRKRNYLATTTKSLLKKLIKWL